MIQLRYRSLNLLAPEFFDLLLLGFRRVLRDLIICQRLCMHPGCFGVHEEPLPKILEMLSTELFISDLPDIPKYGLPLISVPICIGLGFDYF